MNSLQPVGGRKARLKKGTVMPTLDGPPPSHERELSPFIELVYDNNCFYFMRLK